MSRKILITLLAVVAIIAAGVFVVTAQDDEDTTPFPFGRGWMHQWDGEDAGPGMMWGGRGGMMRGFGPGMMWGADETMMSDVAEALGLEPEALFEAMREGQTLVEIAEAQGVELEAVYAAMLAQAASHMAQMVEDGVITQAQADEHLAWMSENISEMPMFSGEAGPCMRGHDGPGMMGRGGRGRWNNG